MTDNEIIKALECCSEPAGKCCCEECPLHHRDDSCTTALIKIVVKLVNRQKTEIERLKAEANCADGYADALVEKTKSEAIKEFEKRLKLTFDKAVNGIPKNSKAHSLRGAIIHDAHLIIDHVKKEMVG